MQRGQFHATWRIAEQPALEALERFRCKTNRCNRYALGPSGHCAACTTERMRSVRWPGSPGKIRKVCPECGSAREVYPSLQRSGDACARCSIAAEDRETTAALVNEGLVPIKTATSLLYLSPGALRSVVTPERRQLGRRAHGRLGVNARDVLRLSTHKNARGVLAKPLAVLNGTTVLNSRNPVGHPVALSPAELALVVELRAADPGVWGWRTLSKKLNEQRPPDKRVSHMAVKRAFERATAPAPALV